VTSSFDWAIVLDIGVGLGILLVGIGVLTVCKALASTLERVNVTLGEVDKQISNLSVPVVRTLDHVGGIADTADATLARLGAAVGQLETAANAVAKTTALASDAVSPAVVNVGATLTGLSAGIRRLVRGGRSNDGLHGDVMPHEDRP
jgi:uncharacterized protein YoxC